MGGTWISTVPRRRSTQTLYAEAFAAEQRRRAHRVVTDHGIYPDTVNVEIDFAGFRDAVHRRAAQRFTAFQDRLWRSGAAGYQFLVDARMAGLHDVGYLRVMRRHASLATFTNIDRAVARGEAAAAVARTVRDTSADALIVGSALLSGGTSLAVLGDGSLLSGGGVYQDTGRVGAAVFTATTKFAFGLIPLTRTTMVGSATLSTAEQRVLFWIGVQNNVLTDTASGLLQGQDAKEAMLNGLFNAGFGAVVDKLGDRFFNSLSVPVQVVTEVARGQPVSAAAGALATYVSGHRPIPPTAGVMSVACAVAEGRGETRQFAENYVSLLAMSPVFPSTQPTTGPEMMEGMRRMW